jgi:hypothetical protein
MSLSSQISSDPRLRSDAVYAQNLIRNPIVSTIQSGHYLTLYRRGRAVRPDAYAPPA